MFGSDRILGRDQLRIHFDEDSGTVQANGETHGMSLEWGKMQKLVYAGIKNELDPDQLQYGKLHAQDDSEEEEVVLEDIFAVIREQMTKWMEIY